MLLLLENMETRAVNSLFNSLVKKGKHSSFLILKNIFLVAVWSGVNVAGVNLSAHDLTTGASNSDVKKNDEGKLEEEIHKKVVQSAYEIIRLKGYTRLLLILKIY
ncbi:hypothetical protein ACQ4LE_003440 [Meloidogyne hapla]